MSLHGALLLVAGLTLLALGAELVVRGASRLAAALGIKPMMLGLTVVALGTSMPELAIGITASQQGSGALVLGNIAGTNVCNILFILGLSAFLRPLPLDLHVLRLDLPAMLGAAAMMTVMAWDGALTRRDGAILFAAAVLYTLILIRFIRSESQAVKAQFRDIYGEETTSMRDRVRSRAHYTVLLLAGMAITILGADWLVKGAIDMASAFGISEAIIGLTIVAVGTSAPELATTIVATLRNERDVAVGNLLGSSIYNIFFILGVTCMLAPHGLPVERMLLLVDIPLMAGVALLCVPVFLTGKQVSRREGGMYVAIYIAYILSLTVFRA